MTLPKTMRHIAITTAGGPEVLHWTHGPVPTLCTDEVLIRVAAAGVNRPDVMQRRGLYPPPPGASDILGLEVAGTIVAIGEHVGDWRVGDVVCALLTGGGYAEYAVAASALCLPIPAGVSIIEAASLPETYFTVWSNLFDRAHLQAGESVLVHGGSSGIGVTAIQLAKAFGATVFVTAGNPEKCRFCEQLGAQAAIDYRAEDFVARIKHLTNERGVDVILDIVGGDYLARNLQSLAEDGRLVILAVQQGIKAEINLLPILLKRLTVTGSTLRPRPIAFKAAIARALREKVWPLFAIQQLRPVIDCVLPMPDAVSAHRLMESNAHKGKIVLTVPQEY